MPFASDIAGFSRLVTALAPWLDQVVIVGGWAHRLYYLHPYAQKPDFAPLITLDADIALPPALPAQTPTIREALVANGFEEEFRGDDMPPATHYHLGGNDSGFYAEFLTPLTGSVYTRTGKRKATAQVAGVNSQQLRFIELLLNDPWNIKLRVGDFELSAPKVVRIANPVGFLYIHDTLQVFGARLNDLRNEWVSRVRPRLHAKAAKTVETAHDWLFDEMTDVIRGAAVMAVDRSLTAESVRESCQYGLQQITG